MKQMQLEVIEPMDGSLMTYSREQCFKDCPRKHYYRYELGLRREHTIAQPLRMGGALHLGTDLWRRGTPQSEVIPRALASYAEVPPWATTDELKYEWLIEREIVGRLLSGYMWYYHADDSEFEVLASEQKFNLPLKNPETGGTSRTFRRGGMLDGCVRLLRKNNKSALLETKTTSEDISPKSDYWRRLEIDSQVSKYFMAANDLGLDVQTIVYDVIRKPRERPCLIPELDENGLKIVVDKNGDRVMQDKDPTKPRQAADKKHGWTLVSRRETPREYGDRLMTTILSRPSEFFVRREIPRLRADLEEAAIEQWQIAQQVIECRRYGRWYRNTRQCTNMGKCEYFDICTQGGLDIGNEIPSGWVQTNVLHEELQ